MKVYQCPICGKVVEVIEERNTSLLCCGKEMKLLEANTVDASKEKHVPSYRIEDKMLIVQIGEVEHPMEEDHYIPWIALEKEGKITRVNWNPHEKPIATFPYEGKSTIYAYCNKHGLWKKEVE